MKFCCECQYEYYHKDKRCCNVVTVGKLNPDFDCRYYEKKKEYKITSEQVHWVSDTLEAIGDPTSNKFWQKQFPEEFKPKQEYCCDVFKQAVSRGDIFPIYDNNKNIWNTSRGWYQHRCFNCGKKPISPIK